MRQAPKDGFGLRNGGELEIFFIGTGSAFAATTNQTNFLIVKGNTHVMVDFGMTAPQALRQVAGLQPTDIELVLPTHSHADHVGGLECLALMNRYVGRRFMNKPKISMIIADEYQRVLWDYTLRGGLEWNEKSLTEGHKLSFGDFFDVICPVWLTHQPREIFKIEVDGITIEMFRTKHIPEQAENWEASFVSYGLFIDDRVFISGDTRFDQQLIDMYAGRSEIMFHDVQFFPGAVHAFLGDLKNLFPEIRRKMLLMHYADNWPEQNIDGFAGWAEQGVRYIFD